MLKQQGCKIILGGTKRKCSLFFRYDNGGNNVYDQAAAYASESEDDPEKAYNGWIYMEIFADASAYSADHAVADGFGQFFTHVIHRFLFLRKV